MSWEGKVYVTAANPYPGQMRPIEGAQPDRSGNLSMAPDNGIGMNVYIAGGAGPGGAVVVTGNLGLSLSGASISGSFGGDVNITASIPLTVTSSQGSPVWTTGSAYILNPVTQVTASIPGTVAVSQTNVPLTQAVTFAQPIQVRGVVDVTSTLQVTGTVALESTGVFVTNLPATQSVSGVGVFLVREQSPVTGVEVTNLPPTQSVFVINQTSGSVTIDGTASITGTVHVDNPVTAIDVNNFPATQSVYVVNQTSGSVSVSGTASITGVVHVDNLPATQSVYVINQLSGVIAVSQTNPVLTSSVEVSNFPATQQVEISGITPVSGYLPVSGNLQVSLSGSSEVSITASIPLTVTSSQASPVWVTGVSVPASVTASITGVVAVSQTNPVTLVTVSGTGVFLVQEQNPITGVSVNNWPATIQVTAPAELPLYVLPAGPFEVSQSNPVLTSSVTVLNFPATTSVTGTVAVSNLPLTQTVSGTVGLSGPVAVTGVVTASITGALSATILNLPATQSVYVVNQSSASLGVVEISGVTAISGYLPVTGQISVDLSGATISASISADININGLTVSNNYSIPFPTASVVLLPANVNRKGFAIFNDTNQNVLIRFGSTASMTAWTFNLYPQFFYEPTAQVWKGDIACIGVGPGSGALQVEEMFL